MSFHLYRPDLPLSQQPRPLFQSHIPAGFPSPADDFIEKPLDLNDYAIKHPAATFFAWCEGESLRDLGINDGDLLIIDRSIEPRHGMIVVAAIRGELTCKILDLKGMALRSANSEYPSFSIQGLDDLVIEGVVTHTVKRHITP